ncbi:uncharacterized protein LOC126805192 isoform X2 [Argentina anserina]|uniref:uncharacterized protein LOC126805192 isoform X2 n=1 Tax=Argentina anserina TaxID=57926 RepID=UPI00217630A4|nr:uncharacterized protein LOC126805192 isoform X2 [Potentilla anserina]
MCSDSNLSNLHRLIVEALRPYTEKDDVSATKERELLVSLSQVLREVKLWVEEVDSDFDNGVVVGLDSENDCVCLSEILTHLIVLLTVESRYVKHLACDVLVVVSKFVAASGSHWGVFILLLCDCMDLALKAGMSCSGSTSAARASEVCSSSSSLIIGLKPKLKNGDWSVAAGVVRVLRDILKYLKSADDDELVEEFIERVSSFLSTVPWDLLNGIHFGPNADALNSSRADVSFQRTLFIGNLIQFFCSLVEPGGVVEAACGSSEKCNPVFSTIINVVPKLLSLCLGEQVDCVISNNRISQYFKHKLLVLMIRLIVQTFPESTMLVSWLQLIHHYFEELLRQPISCSQEDCLEGSPFLFNVSDSEVNCLSSHHLQRQAVFLFLKCTFSLINSKGGTNRKCACASWNISLFNDSNAELLCCERKKGLLELYNWLRGHLPTDMLVDHETYIKNCADFSKSFLQLYIKEDDVLFEVLLQLLSVPFSADKQYEKVKGSFHDLKDNMLFVISDLFNPVILFHLFLVELSYDHQVLLDYLISKDTGISCAEYLLRCLRYVCDSWNLFVEFPPSGQATDGSSCKKRKISVTGSRFCGGNFFAVIDFPGSFLKDVCDDENIYGCKHTRGNFQEAKECLLSLKSSIESLHQKNLFPYNPNALLKRLLRFQELCFEAGK